MRIDQLQPYLYHDYGLEEEEEETEVDGNNNNNTQRSREGSTSTTGTSPHYHHYYTGTNNTLTTLTEGSGSGIGIAGEIITTQTRNQHYRNKIMRFIAYIILLSAMFMGIVGLPYLTWHSFHHNGNEKRIDFIALYSAGLITEFTLIVSVYQIYMHLTHFVMPDPQKYVVRILFMVPFYSVQSYLSLLFFEERLYTDTLRDLYEAFTISSFLYLMIELLGGEENISQILDQKREHNNNHNTHIQQQQQNNNQHQQTHQIGQHHFPFNLCLPEWKMGSHYLLECKYGTLQYVVIKVFTTISTLFLHPLGLYNEGLFSLRDSYIYMVVLINFSQCYALYCLVMFYHVLENDLRHPKNWYPLGKFICVKGVVFFTWWQGIGLTILQNRGVFDIFMKENNNWTPDTVAVFLQDYLIVAEMFLFALAHHFFFSYKEYQNNNEDSFFFEGGDLSSLLLSSSSAGGGRAGRARTLNNPMSMKEAFWNSSVPTETFDDIQRLRRGAQRVVTEREKNEQQNFGGIALMNIKNAESI